MAKENNIIKPKKRKKKGKRYNEINAKIRLNRFFETCREKYNIYAFQNESKLKYEFLKKMNVTCIITLKAKRNFFVEGSDDKLIDEGFVIEYNHFNQELYKQIKEEMINQFRNTFFIRFPKEDLRNKDKEYFGGQIIIKNLKTFSSNEEEKKND